jgi:hypothetical protein
MNKDTVTGSIIILLMLTIFTKMGRHALGMSLMLVTGSIYKCSKISFRVLFGGVKGAYRNGRGLPMADPVKKQKAADIYPTDFNAASPEPAIIMRQPIGTKAHVIFWFYDNLVKRSIFMHAPTLIKKYGYRVRMPDVIPGGIERDEIISDTMNDANAFFTGKTLPEVEKPTEKLVIQQPAVPLPQPQDYTIQQKEFVAQASWTGILSWAGVESRMLGEKQIKQFSVKINDGKLGGAPNQIWGTDLERALRDSGAQLGEMVKVSLIGSDEAAGKNGKKIYHIQVI